MELIQSFSVDHTRIVPGIFTSRVDTVGGDTVTTYDIRLKKPNREPVIDVAAMHSLEHIIATFLRNDPDWKDEVIYWGPMGCLTGFYLILKGNRAPQEIYDKPVNPFVAEFFGNLPINFIKRNGVLYGIRPENIEVRNINEARSGLENGEWIKAELIRQELLGAQKVLYIKVGKENIVVSIDSKEEIIGNMLEIRMVPEKIVWF